MWSWTGKKSKMLAASNLKLGEGERGEDVKHLLKDELSGRDVRSL